MAFFRDIPRAFFNGSLVSGARLSFFASGTSNPLPAYASAQIRRDLTGDPPFDLVPKVEHPLVMKSDIAGRWRLFWLDPALSYRAVVTDEDGVTLADVDPWPGFFTSEDGAQPLSDTGESMPFAELTFFNSGTTEFSGYSILGDPATYTEPLVADETGSFPVVILTDQKAYRVILKDRWGRLIYDVDPYIPFPVMEVREFRASGTWTKPAGARMVRVLVVGAGGGGASGRAGSANNDGGSGGAGGGLSDFWFAADVLPNTVAVTVGVGGTGGPSVSNSPGGGEVIGISGQPGGASSFGPYLKANGGERGQFAAASRAVGGTGLISDGGNGGVVTVGLRDGIASNYGPSGGGCGAGSSFSPGVGGGTMNWAVGPFPGGAANNPGIENGTGVPGTGAGGGTYPGSIGRTGGFPGGGASGGAGHNFGVSGAGGQGGGGSVVVVSYF